MKKDDECCDDDKKKGKKVDEGFSKGTTMHDVLARLRELEANSPQVADAIASAKAYGTPEKKAVNESTTFESLMIQADDVDATNLLDIIKLAGVAEKQGVDSTEAPMMGMDTSGTIEPAMPVDASPVTPIDAGSPMPDPAAADMSVIPSSAGEGPAIDTPPADVAVAIDVPDAPMDAGAAPEAPAADSDPWAMGRADAAEQDPWGLEGSTPTDDGDPWSLGQVDSSADIPDSNADAPAAEEPSEPADADAPEEPTPDPDPADDAAGGDEKVKETHSYDNTPNERVAKPEAAIANGDDMNQEKKSYPPAAGGDNPMFNEDTVVETMRRLNSRFNAVVPTVKK